MSVRVHPLLLKRGKPGVKFEDAEDFEIQAIFVSDHIAVHESIDPLADDWAVTHVPTGMVLTKAASLVAAFEAANALEHLDVDWSFSHPSDRDRITKEQLNLVRFIRAFATAGDLESLRGAS